MKKQLTAILVFVLISTVTVSAVSAGNAGTSSDPLISVSYINTTFSDSALGSVNGAVNTGLQPAYNAASEKLSQAASSYKAQLDRLLTGYTFASSFTQSRVKKDDAISGTTGSSLILLAGSAKVTISKGTVIDVSTGSETASGAALTVLHRYLLAEETEAAFEITSDTAVAEMDSWYGLKSGGSFDYNAVTDILYTAGLFKGDGTGYGSGYALERTATRLEGLIMFIRLLGEENAALSGAGTHPFKDVPAWADKYVAYAYAKGYTKGTGSNTFGTNDTLTSYHYLTFILRALGYSEGTDFTWSTSVADAKGLGIITAGESSAFTNNTFYRAQVSYVSYYTLSAKLKGSNTTLLEKLSASGAVDFNKVKAAMEGFTGTRIS